MYKIFISILMILFLLAGCSQKINKYAKPTDTLHEQSLTQTQKTVLKKGLVTKAYFVTTYISHIDSDLVAVDKLVERFIVSVYVPNDEDKESYNKLIFKINGKKPIVVDELKQESDLLSLLPTVNPWSKYYLIQAPVDKTKQGVSLEAGVSKLGSTSVQFHDKYGNLPMGESIGFETDFDR